MKSYYIYLIRHGMTKANETGCYVGKTDLPLSQNGKAQLIDIKNQAEYPKVDVIYTSPLKRCVETCKIIYPSSNYITIGELCECDFGDWEGKSAKDLENDELFQLWLKDASKNPPPNGESASKFTYRICLAFEKIVESLMRSGTTSAAIVTHSGVLTTLLSSYGIPKAPPMDWMVGPGCGYALRIDPSLWMRGMVMEVYDKTPVFNNKEN